MRNYLINQWLIILICFFSFKNYNAQNQLAFEENNGQLQTQKLGNSTILFKANLPGLCMWVSEKGITYNFYKLSPSNNSDDLTIDKKNSIQTLDWFRSEMLLKNAHISLQNLIKKNKLAYQNNYIKGNNFSSIQTNLYEELYFINVYEGIDWRIYIKNNQVKQEFIVQPFANPKLINLQYVSTGKINVTSNQIQLTNALGIFTEGKLLCYQGNETNSVSANYSYSHQSKKIDDTTINYCNVTINTSNYNTSQALVIDPILQWSTFFGGGVDDDTHAIYSDGVNTWVAGHSQSVNFPTTNPGTPSYYQGSNSGGFGDACLIKFNASHTVIWATYFGGTGNDEAQTVYSNGTDVWVGGYTGSTDFPTLNSGGGAFYQSAVGGNIDGFILKFNIAGQLFWSTYCGGVNADYVNALQFNNNELYVVGVSTSSNYPVVNAGTFFQNYSALNDGFLMKFSTTNSLTLSTLIGGSNNDFVNTIQTNSTSIFIGGHTNSTNFNVLNAGGSSYYQGTLVGGYDGFITKFSLNGTMQWSTFFGGTTTDKYNSLVLDNKYVWLAGTTSSTNIPVLNAGGSAYYQSTNTGFSEGMLTKFTLNGVLKWSSYFGGSSDDFSTGITSDGLNIFVGGYTNSTNIFTTTPGSGAFLQPTTGGFFDGYILKFDSSSTCKWASYFGNASNEYLTAIHSDVSKIYITGYTQSIVLPLLNSGSGAYYQSANAGGIDMFVSAFKNCINPTPVASTSSLICAGSTFTLNANSYPTANYQWFGPLSFFSSTQNPIIANPTTSNSGNYSLFITEANGCVAATSLSVTVNPMPTLSVNTASAICVGNSINFSTTSSATSYSWIGVAGFTSSIQNPVIANSTTLNTGTYILTVSDLLGCTNSASVSVVVNTLPVPTVSSNGTICVGSTINLFGGGGVTYSWQGPPTYTTNTQNPSITNAALSNQGYFVLTVTNVNGCSNKDSVYVPVSLCTGLNKTNTITKFGIYPNPATNIIFIDNSLNQTDDLFIYIYNSEGKKVVFQKYNSHIKIDTLPVGIYLLVIEQDNKSVYLEKIIKQ